MPITANGYRAVVDVSEPEDFLRCPNCRRSTTVELAMHMDGDVAIECRACGELAMAYPLHESCRVYGGENR